MAVSHSNPELFQSKTASLGSGAEETGGHALADIGQHSTEAPMLSLSLGDNQERHTGLKDMEGKCMENFVGIFI